MKSLRGTDQSLEVYALRGLGLGPHVELQKYSRRKLSKDEYNK